MSGNEHWHKMLPSDSTVDVIEASPFRIFRISGSMKLWILSSEAMERSQRAADTCLFHCHPLSEETEEKQPTAPGNVNTSSKHFELRVHTTLLRAASRTLPAQADSQAKSVADPIVCELALAVMNSSPKTQNNAFTLACIIKLLCARIAQLLAEGIESKPQQFENWQLAVLAEALNVAPEECGSVVQIARRCRLSVCQFSRLFRATYGSPLHRYVINERINQAKSRLACTSDPISEIALDCGFADQSSFTRRFTALAGLSPALWRKQTIRREVGVPSQSMGVLHNC